MKTNEITIIEGVRSFLGLDHHDYSKINKLDLGGQHVQSHISELFKLKAAELIHHDSIVSAFNKTQNNMYLDDPAFTVTFMKEMTGRAVPKPEIEDALKYADDVLDKATKEFDSSSAKDAGNHPNLSKIKEVSQPEQATELETIKPRDGHKQESNIKSDMPIDRKDGKRITEAAAEPVTEARGISGSSYNTTIEIETPYETIEAEVSLEFTTEPPEPRTHEYPGSPGGIDIDDFRVTKLTIYDSSNYMEPSKGRFPYSHYFELIKNEVAERTTDLETEIGEHLAAYDEAAHDDYYDRKRDEMRGY